MTDHAQAALTAAARAIVDRPNAHGNVGDNFQCIAEFWALYDKWAARRSKQGAPGVARVDTPLDVSNKFVLMKLARTLTGNQLEPDHYVDQIGYAALSARIAGDMRAANVMSDARTPALGGEIRTDFDASIRDMAQKIGADTRQGSVAIKLRESGLPANSTRSDNDV